MAASAPIALFIFKRTDHLQRAVRSLQRSAGFADSRVIVFGDGPRSAAEIPAVEAARRAAKELLGTEAEYRFSAKNLGLSRSIIDGVGDVLARFGRVIVIEDDLEISPGFLAYVNAALDRYDGHPEVFQVSGHMFDTPKVARGGSAIFLPMTTTWGWATWSRAWARFDPAAAGCESLGTDRKLRLRFNLGGRYDYSTMLDRQMAGLGDSWGIRWYWSVFRNGGVACFPPWSLVRNTGMDGSGTHGRGLLRGFGGRHEIQSGAAIDFPDQVAVNEEAFELVKQTIWRQNGGWVGAAVDRLRRGLGRLQNIR